MMDDDNCRLSTNGTEEASPFLFQNWKTNPAAFFNTCLLVVAMIATSVATYLHQHNYHKNPEDFIHKENVQHQHDKPHAVTTLQYHFLLVFWLLKLSDWLQGPYFYEVYASKVGNRGSSGSGSMGMISKLFLTGFAATAILGPSAGRLSEQYGRKKGTLAFCVFYGLAALSTKSRWLLVLFAGRICSGIATSLLFSAPESWLVGQFQDVVGVRGGGDGGGQAQEQEEEGSSRSPSPSSSPSYLEETFALAYAGDSCVAIAAGQIATLMASFRGPTGPFELSTVCVVVAGFLTVWLWKENKSTTTTTSPTTAAKDHEEEKERVSIRDAIKIIRQDTNILLIGVVQSLFEAAMYIFVMEWAPAMEIAIKQSFSVNDNAESSSVPYGTIFSCFMACGLLGSMLFGQVIKMSPNLLSIEDVMAVMLTVASACMAGAASIVSASTNTKQNDDRSTLWCLLSCFFCFEACVGMYFPSIGTLRSKYLHSHRSVIMNLFGVPLNMLVACVFLTLDHLGLQGAFVISAFALGIAACAMIRLRSRIHR